MQHKIWQPLGSFRVRRQVKLLEFHSFIVASSETLAMKSLLADHSKAETEK